VCVCVRVCVYVLYIYNMCVCVSSNDTKVFMLQRVEGEVCWVFPALKDVRTHIYTHTCTHTCTHIHTHTCTHTHTHTHTHSHTQKCFFIHTLTEREILTDIYILCFVCVCPITIVGVVIICKTTNIFTTFFFAEKK